MILTDSSYWVSYLRDDEFAQELDDLLRSGAAIACTEPVLMEVIGGTRTSEEYSRVRNLLRGQHWLAFDSVADFDAASLVYSAARRAGKTPASHVDCMITAVALRHRAQLMTRDKQQADIARLVGVELYV